jgi:hydrogenase nickel incorporation protein HypA/HybF
MHEYPVAKQILKIALNTAQENKASKITKISLVVGELSGFIGESIQMYFNIISKGTIAENAEITVKPVKLKLKCSSCGKYFERKEYSFECPDCGGKGDLSDIGKEFYIENIEIED